MVVVLQGANAHLKKTQSHFQVAIHDPTVQRASVRLCLHAWCLGGTHPDRSPLCCTGGALISNFSGGPWLIIQCVVGGLGRQAGGVKWFTEDQLVHNPLLVRFNHMTSYILHSHVRCLCVNVNGGGGCFGAVSG